MTKSVYIIFGTSIYRHISLKKHENLQEDQSPKHKNIKLIYKRKLKAQKHRT